MKFKILVIVNYACSVMHEHIIISPNIQIHLPIFLNSTNQLQGVSENYDFTVIGVLKSRDRMYGDECMQW